MSHNYSIRNLLNIKDKNIFFEENFCTEETVKGVTSKVFHGILTYQPKACYVCGLVFDHQIIKHGFKTSIIKMPSVSGFNAYLKLKKQRYYCKHCGSTFTLTTDVVAKNCYISNNTKAAIALHAKEKISEKDIAKHHNVSHSTVNRIINSFYNYFKPNFDYLPKHLCFDEFKSVKSAAGAMSFIFCDSKTGKIVDISKVDYIHFRYHHSFKKQMREKDIIHYLIDLDPELKASYELYQYVLLCLRTKNFKLLKKVLSTKQKHVSDYMKTAIHTTKKYLSYVENTFKYKYNNGLLEGINNKIKTIKRIAFG